MLISMRYVAEKLYIGDDIEMAVVKIKGALVSLGNAAPGNVEVYRQEIYQRVHISHSSSRSTRHPESLHSIQVHRSCGRVGCPSKAR